MNTEENILLLCERAEINAINSPLKYDLFAQTQTKNQFDKKTSLDYQQ
jgi:hypothetical protein